MTRTALLALSLVACGDKDGEDTGDFMYTHGDTDTDTDADSDTDSDADADADADDADLTAGCLDSPCNLPSVAATALARCYEADAAGGTGGVQAQYIESRDSSDPYIGVNCSSNAFTDETCGTYCSDLGFSSDSHEGTSCRCRNVVGSSGSLAVTLAGQACSSPLATFVLSMVRGTVETNTMRVACAGGTTPTGDCDTVLDTFNAELSAGWSDASSTSSGCSLGD